MSRLAHAAHLARRFAGSLAPGGPAPDDEAWARRHLLPGEVALWQRMRNPDRRHAVAVALDVSHRLGPAADRPVVAAALLHDVGKLDAGLGTYGRVVATLCGAVAGRSMAREWSKARGFTRRVGLYLRHDEIGGDMLALAGSHATTVAWARQHHLPAEQWTLAPEVADALKAADDD